MRAVGPRLHGRPVSTVGQVWVTWSRSTNEGWNRCCRRLARYELEQSAILSISEREGRSDRQSGSLFGPGCQRCDFLVKSSVLKFNHVYISVNVRGT